MFDPNTDSDGNNVEEWSLGIPAMMGQDIMFDLSNGINFARNDGLRASSPTSVSDALLPEHYTSIMKVIGWIGANSKYF